MEYRLWYTTELLSGSSSSSNLNTREYHLDIVKTEVEAWYQEQTDKLSTITLAHVWRVNN